MRAVDEASRSPVRTSNPQYVYGIVDAEDAGPSPGPGLFGRPVRFLTSGRLAAVTSDVEGPVPGRREDLLAHFEVLEAVARTTLVLPMRFGTVFDSEVDVLRELLDRQAPALERLLGELDGTVEVSVKAIFDQDEVMQEVLSEHSKIRRLSERTRDLPEGATYFDRIRLGELVAGALEAKRQEAARDVLSALSPAAIRVARSDPGLEYMALSASFLVARNEVEAFEKRIGQVEKTFGGRLRFRVTAPLPPYSFVSLERNTGSGRGA